MSDELTPTTSAASVAEPEVIPCDQAARDLSRRKLMVFGVNSITATLLGVPILGYLLGPILRRIEPQKVEVGPLDAYSAEQPKRVRITYETPGVVKEKVTQNVWVGIEEGKPVVFSSQCTHLGCNVSWKKDESVYFCPCHGAKFSPRGDVLAGPPPAPLRRLPSFVENEKVFVNIG